MLRRVLVHLIDGTYELFRAFYGGPRARAPSGAETGATRTLMRSFLGLLRQPEVTHVACAFDHVIESFRNDLFPGYKTSAGIEPDLLSQFELAEVACRLLGIVTWPMIEFEADDAIASAADACARDPRVEQVLICSPDKDMAQCVRGSSIVMLDRMRKKQLDEAAVIAKFGVPPASIPDYLALVGDAADGIPGIPGWGAKSAALILAKYGSIEAIPAEASSWDVPIRSALTLATKLREQREAALLYKRLATLRLDVPLGITVDDLEWRSVNDVELPLFCQVLGDQRFLERLGAASA